MRVGVGVGAVMLGGCDAVAEAKARVLGEETKVSEEVSAEVAPVAAPVATAPTAPEPMLLGRDGVAGVVEDVRARSNAAALASDRSVETRPSVVPPVEDLGRPRSEPEGSHAFVPYSEASVGALAVAPERPLAAEKPRTRTRPKPVHKPEPPREWVCGPCGRG